MTAKPTPASKMEAVRQALDVMGLDAKPKEIQDFLRTKFGLEMNSNMASNYKCHLAKQSGPKKKEEKSRTPKPLLESAPPPSAAPAPAGNQAPSDDFLPLLKALLTRVVTFASQDAEFLTHLRALVKAASNGQQAAPSLLQAVSNVPPDISPIVAHEPEAPPSLDKAGANDKAPAPSVPKVGGSDKAPAPSIPNKSFAPSPPREPLPRVPSFPKAPPAPRFVKIDPVPPAVSVVSKEPPSPPAATPSVEFKVQEKNRYPYPETIDIPLIDQRCRLKAESARWAAERQRLLEKGGSYKQDIEVRDQDLIARTKTLENCFLWMLHATTPALKSPPLLQDLAECFDLVAQGALLAQKILDNMKLARRLLEPALILLAEAHSALRASVLLTSNKADFDQMLIHNWLRELTMEHRIYIPRYMRAEDLAEPGCWISLKPRIQDLEARFEESVQREKSRKKLFDKIRYLCGTLAAARENDDKFTDNWKRLMEVVEELLGTGVSPSNVELRELLLPVIEGVPDFEEMPKGFKLVLRETDTFLSNRPGAEAAAETFEPSAEVKEAGRLLKDRCVVLIGGVPSPHSSEMLRRAMQLKELIWVDTQAHQSYEYFEPFIAQPDVAVVILAIRWSSHSYTEVRKFCDKYGKPLVRLPGGYNANQVASQILSQCSGRLEKNQTCVV